MNYTLGALSFKIINKGFSIKTAFFFFLIDELYSYVFKVFAIIFNVYLLKGFGVPRIISLNIDFIILNCNCKPQWRYGICTHSAHQEYIKKI